MAHYLKLIALLLLAVPAAAVLVHPPAARSETTLWAVAVGLATAVASVIVSFVEGEQRHAR